MLLTIIVAFVAGAAVDHFVPKVYNFVTGASTVVKAEVSKVEGSN